MVDILIVFSYTTILIVVALFYKSRQLNVLNREEYRYFVPALLAKIIGGQLFALIYNFYYYAGDTFVYYNSSCAFFDYFFIDLNNALHIFSSSSSELINEGFEYNTGQTLYSLPGGRNLPFYHDSGFLFMSKIIIFFIPITLKSYFGITLLFSLLSFTGLWKLYQTFNIYLPNKQKELALLCFFIPSLTFWGSGLMKDSLTIGGLGWMVFTIEKIVFQKKFKISYLLSFVIWSFITFQLKAYIFLTLFSSFTIWYFFDNNKKVTNAFYRIVISPLFMVLIAIGGLYGITKVAEGNEKYDMNNIITTAKTYNSYHTSLKNDADGGGSTYSLGEIDYSTMGIITKIPAAINVTLFRPYIWESHNIVMLFSAFESLGILLITLITIGKVGIFKIKNTISANPFIIMCLFYSLIMAFSVGITSFNFGALNRYKIPAIIFYVFCLLYIWANYETKDQITKLKNENNIRKKIRSRIRF